MKNTILILLLLTITVKLESQNEKLKKIPYYLDSEIIEQLCDSISKQNIESFYVYLMQSNNVQTTYLFWNEKEIFNVYKLNNDSILKSKLNYNIFKNIDIKGLAVLEKECQLKFIAPLIPDSNCSYFIYWNKNDNCLLIDNGCSDFYQSDNKKEGSKYFFDLVKCKLKILESINWEFYSIYKRF